MRSWDEITAYYQGFAHDPHYAAFVHDMLIAVDTLREHAALSLPPRDVVAGMITFLLPDTTRQPSLGWFKPGVYSTFTRDAESKLYDAQFVTLNGVISALQALTTRVMPTTEPSSPLPVSR